MILLWVTAGCTNFMLHPDKTDHAPGFSETHIVEEGYLDSKNGVRIHFWKMPAQNLGRKASGASKGLIVLCPGNGNNLTHHISHSAWLAEHGYDLLIFDYRGHGQSTGRPSIAGSYDDVVSVLDYATAAVRHDGQRLFFYGQSLGGTLLLKAVSKNPKRWNPEAVIAEDPFFSFKQIARERVNASGAPFPIGWYSYLMFSDRYALREEELAQISPIPVLLFCSKNDPVVSAHHCQHVKQSLAEPMLLVKYAEHGHLQAMTLANSKSRKILLEELATNSSFRDVSQTLARAKEAKSQPRWPLKM